MTQIPEMTELEKTLFTGIHGEVVIKKEERAKYLGELAERVALALTFSDMAQREIDERLIKAIKENTVSSLVMSGQIDSRDWAQKYKNFAKENKIPLRIVSDPEHVGKNGLIAIKG